MKTWGSVVSDCIDAWNRDDLQGILDFLQQMNPDFKDNMDDSRSVLTEIPSITVKPRHHVTEKNTASITELVSGNDTSFFWTTRCRP